jgi:hypothetical protein
MKALVLKHIACDGTMDVWDVEEHTWLAAEKRAIRHWVREARAALSGRLPGPPAACRCGRWHVRTAAAAKGGICEVSLNEAGKRNPVFGRLPERTKALQWQWRSGGRGAWTMR